MNLYYSIREKPAVSANLWLNMLTLLFHISRPFNMYFLHYFTFFQRSKEQLRLTKSTLFDVEVMRDFLCCINKHSVVLTNTQGVNSIHSHRCEG